MAIAAGGPDLGDDELLGSFERLCEMARRLAPAASYGYVRFGPHADLHSASTEWSGEGGPQIEAGWALDLRDEMAFDAFPYQILGPGHLARLGGPPPGAEDLGGGRVGVAIGDPASWLYDLSVPRWTHPYPMSTVTRDPDIRAKARRLLGPCLLTELEAWDLNIARYGS